MGCPHTETARGDVGLPGGPLKCRRCWALKMDVRIPGDPEEGRFGGWSPNMQPPPDKDEV